MDTEGIAKYYRHCLSIRQTAAYFGIIPQKCRRLLISTGDFSSDLSGRISELLERGLDAAQIAEHLGMRLKTVQGYIPYTKGIYHAENPTPNALAIRRCRAKRSARKEIGENA